MPFDVAIAGAGIIGSSIAWRLAQRGARVTLLDAGRLGGETSSAGAGMLALGGEIESQAGWSDLAMEGLRLYPGFVAELEEESGLRIDFQRRGAVELALSGKEWMALQARAERQSGLGIPSSVISPEDLRKHAPLARQDVAGAVFYPHDGLVDPRDVMAALRVACLQQGVDLREGVRVTEILPRGGSVRLATSAGAVETRAGVLAAGAWSSQIPVEGVTLPRVFPVRGHLIGFQLEPYSLGPLVRRGHTYLLQRSGGFMVAGTSSEQAGFNRTLDPGVIADIRARAVEILPVLAGREPSAAWLGFRPAVEGDRPAIGRAGDSALWLAYGHYRNGILMAPATAQRVAQGIISRGETDPSGLPGKR